MKHMNPLAIRTADNCKDVSILLCEVKDVFEAVSMMSHALDDDCRREPFQTIADKGCSIVDEIESLLEGARDTQPGAAS